MANNTQKPANKQQMYLLMIMMAVLLYWNFHVMGQKKQPEKPPNPTVSLKKADDAVKSKHWQDAFSGYREASSKLSKTQGGAVAMLRLAEALRDATGGRKTWIGTWSTNRDEFNAVETYKSLISQYGKANYPEVAQAKREMLALRIKMDREASKHWMYGFMDSLVGFGKTLHFGRYSYAFALLLITLIIKLVTWKLSVTQYKGMRDMQRIQPVIKEIQEKYKGDPKAVNTKVMEAYKEHGVNPLMGCLPLLVQMPVMYVIWYAIRRYEFQFQNGTFLWINGYMHAHYPSITLPIVGQIPFIGANLAQPDIPLVILYTISMFITQRLTIVDPTQAEQQKIMSIMMPLMLAFFFYKFASAFMLYWLMLNIVMTAHQYYVMKAHAQPSIVVESAAGGQSSARKRRRRR
jgi:YidC/Oxa1 family membrane protein insertase